MDNKEFFEWAYNHLNLIQDNAEHTKDAIVHGANMLGIDIPECEQFRLDPKNDGKPRKKYKQGDLLSND